MKKKKTLWGLAAAAGLTLLAGIGLLEKADLRALDLWYQTRRPTGGEVVMVEIDDRALEVIGPYEEWGRGIMAQVIETLNQSEECRPAAIGLDVLYTGEKDPENDAWLAEAAGAYDNVVTACAAVFGDSIENNDDGSFYVNTFSVQMFDEPYEALREAADLGHINAMLDTDGVLRHHLLKYTLPDGRFRPWHCGWRKNTGNIMGKNLRSFLLWMNTDSGMCHFTAFREILMNPFLWRMC